LEEIAKIPIENLLYMDESGMDDNEEISYGYSMKGDRCYGEKQSRRNKRTTFIATYSPVQKGLSSCFCFEGYTDANIFGIWIKECLLPNLKPDITVVMDNASFHKKESLRELIESRGAKVKFLPTYSPDFNPIEKIWAQLKSKIKKYKELYQFDDAVDLAFKDLRQPIPI